MRVDCALVCDAVTVRDGLLHILGGGVTRIQNKEYPAPLGISLAIRVMVHPTEAQAPHTLTLVLQGEDGQQVVGIEAQFEIDALGSVQPGEEFSLPMALPLAAAPIPFAGNYSFELLIDGIHQTSIPFTAGRIEQTELPLEESSE